jgi:lipopolysaccharide transport system ATP-binding protein
MAKIILKNASVTMPIYDANSRSFKKDVMATFSRMSTSNNVVYIKSLENIDLVIEAGDRIGLVGENGAGKSTLLRLLSGVYHPTEGVADIRGSVGTLIDISLGIDTEATGLENIYIRGAYLGENNKKMKEFEAEIINFSGLKQVINLPVRTYSSGMQMRLAFAISTVLNKDILIMDEWLSVGDEEFSRKVDIKLSSMIDKSKIFVIASHSKELIRKHCNRVVQLEKGRITMNERIV